MATTLEPILELAMKLRLSKAATEKLALRAAESGQDVSAVVSDLIEQAIAKPTADELLAPFRKQVAESGMTDKEIDDFFRGELDAHRREPRAKTP